MSLHEANRQRLAQKLRENPECAKGLVVLQGGGTEDHLRYSTDAGEAFRQESYFHWAFGVLDPDWYGAVDVDTGKSYLFMPKLHESYAIWDGRIKTPEEFKKRYGVDEVYYLEDMTKVYERLGGVHVRTSNDIYDYIRNWTKEAVYQGFGEFKVDNQLLFPVLSEVRVRKTEEELDVLRFAARVSADAHVEVMKLARPGMMEYQLEAIFKHFVFFFGGMRHVAYTCICGSGPNGAVLHYGGANAPNDKVVNDGDMCLLDMGGEYYCYVSDITCSFPVNGKFTEDQKAVYNAVLRANKAVMDSVKPGVSWVDMHVLANRVILEDLVKVGLLRGKVDDMMKVNLGATFQPHGLGHLMGCDVHDCGGYLDHCPPRPQLPGLRSLRTARTLESNMVITIEPGCYFIDTLLDQAMANPELAKFFVPEVLQRFRGFGGVRIEDDIVVTETGMELLNVGIPRTVEGIEAVMAEGKKLNVRMPEKLLTGFKKPSSS
ncbi:unnamed protein product [Notodromas monacha]|uniref:Xaa-Pro dipeptidase n=1 Tax=Notodromas monacha TaxID=399045 RepID=A0A7R9GGQ2_9CRUS|nr:unnamed protein product [Notodromas monacha]CAG0921963.1 unnamed protein product [Notodromas monacha]